jgi:hypothetical protein
MSTYLLAIALTQTGSVSWGPLLAVVGIVLLLGWCSRRVVDGLWTRRERESEQRLVETARRVGIRSSVVFTPIFAAFAIHQAPPHLRVRALVLVATLTLCFGFAMWLGAGYLWAVILRKLDPQGRRRGGE